MKKIALIIAALSALVLSGCAPKNTEPLKDLVIYYSQTGTTKALAEQFASQLGADIIAITPETPYPDSYDATLEVAKSECGDMTGHAITNDPIDFTKYGRIFIGYPVWFGTITPPIVSLAKDNNLFDGKDVVLFCTFGSGGTRTSSNAFKDLCPNANVLGTFGITAKRVPLRAESEVSGFLASLGVEETEPESTEGLVGAYSERRDLDEYDQEVFNKISEAYAYLNLTAKGVSSQVVAGTNYIFYCTSGMDSDAEVQVKVFAPLPGQGEPELVEVMR